MMNEDDLQREPPPVPYVLGSAQLHIPVQALEATYKLLQRAGHRESGVIWYGPRGEGGSGVVHFVVAPRQKMNRGNYAVSVEALTEIVHRLPNGWKPLAQIHSHPGEWVEHSTYDDEMVSSHRILSLVFPFYGRRSGDFLHGVGIHEWQNGYWHLLEGDDRTHRVQKAEGEVLVEDMR